MSILNNISYYLMCLYLILLPFLRTNNKLIFHGKGIPIADAILGIILLFYIGKLLVNRESRAKFILGLKDFFTNYLSICMTILAFIMFLSVSYAVEKKLALSESLRFVSYVALYFIIKYDINDEKYINGMVKSYIFTSLAISAFGVYQYFTGFALDSVFKQNYGYTRYKIAATMDNPNNLAAFLILALFPLIMLCIYEKRKLQRLFYALSSMLILVDIVLTGSRNGLIGIIIGMVVLAVLYSLRLFIFTGFLGVVALFIPEVRERLMAITDKTQNESRVYLWEIAKRMIKDHPLFGVGNGNYATLYDRYIEIYPQFKFYKPVKATHNSYLKVESELGIIGGISFVGILVLALIQVKKTISTTNNKFYKFFYTGFLASMAAFYVMNLLDNLFFVPKTTTYFWVLLAMSQAIIFRVGGDYYKSTSNNIW